MSPIKWLLCAPWSPWHKPEQVVCDRQYTTASEIQKLQVSAMPNSTKIWRTQPPDCHIHISLLVWLPGPLLSQLSGQKVPAPHCTASFAPEWRSEENYNKSCAHFLLMPSKPSVTTPSKTPEKSDTGQLWDQWVLGWGSGKGKQNTQCHGHCQDIPRWQGPAGPSKHLGLEDCKKKQS